METAKARVPVLLVHGIRASASMWRFQEQKLRAAGHPVLAIDLPGHGQRMGEPFTVPAALAAIDDGVLALGGRVLLVGLSLGGYYAVAYAAKHPDRVAGLVAAGCSAEPKGLLLEGYRLLARMIHRLPDRGLWLHETMARRLLPPAGARDVLTGGAALDVMDAGLHATSTLTPLTSLAEYPGPIWLVNGALDHFRLNERRFLAACANGEVVVVPGATHLASLAQPERFTTILLRVAEQVSAA
ncbi:MAG: alpha/beta hydrolase [Cryobacterium sp.]|uniref:alpha/beta fold hydrolase n=1 Tax=unclassified Cryobacterium TaxID=2649013 RepID=UPI0018CA9F40|nr:MULTISPECIES: alpha/beta hydrolase [unclassified Cryobacterium]MCY7404577.1 alpha/beta hydrolase [Cryobacterium sp.]MEC5153892.1 pimeloyl-ACP methyl ester carboxylesterase [Cryobacterium sp. CAN_C3]